MPAIAAAATADAQPGSVSPPRPRHRPPPLAPVAAGGNGASVAAEAAGRDERAAQTQSSTSTATSDKTAADAETAAATAPASGAAAAPPRSRVRGWSLLRRKASRLREMSAAQTAQAANASQTPPQTQTQSQTQTQTQTQTQAAINGGADEAEEAEDDEWADATGQGAPGATPGTELLLPEPVACPLCMALLHAAPQALRHLQRCLALHDPYHVAAEAEKDAGGMSDTQRLTAALNRARQAHAASAAAATAAALAEEQREARESAALRWRSSSESGSSSSNGSPAVMSPRSRLKKPNSSSTLDAAAPSEAGSTVNSPMRRRQVTWDDANISVMHYDRTQPLQDNGSPTTSEDEPQPNEQTHKGLLNLAGRATRRANADNGGLMMLLLLLASVVPVIVAIYVFVFNDGSSGL